MKRIVVSEHVQVDLFGCHRWTRRKDKDGYGRVGEDMAHRRAWEEVYGPIPAGMQVHHECEVRDCLNTEHMMLVTPSEHALLNVNSAAGRNRRKRYCINGHLFDEANTYRWTDGSRHCRKCNAAASKRCTARKKASGKSSITTKATGRRRPTSRPPNKAPKR